MKTGTTSSNARHLCIAAIVMAALIGTVNSLALTYHFGNGAFQADYFRHFLYNVMPILDGTGSLSRLFTNHHASPLLHLHQIFTSYVLKTSLRVDAYAGILLFFSMAAYLAVAAFHELAVRSGSKFYALLVALSIALVMTGLTTAGPISWPLIYLQAYFLCLGLILGISTYLLCTQPRSGNRQALYVGSVIIMVLLHSSYGVLFFVASVAAIAIRAIPQRNYKLLVLLLGTAMFVYSWNAHVLAYFGQMEARNTSDSASNLAALFGQMPLLLAIFGKAVAAGFYGDAYAYVVDKNALPSWQMICFFSIAVAYAAATLWALMAQRKVLVAGVVMLAIGLGAVTVVVFRGNGTFPFTIDASRYVLLYKFAAGAFVWSSADALASLFRGVARRISQGIRNILLSVIALGFLGAIIAIQLVAFTVISQRQTSLATLAGWNELSVYMLGVDSTNTFTLQNWHSGNNGSRVNTPVINWLVRNEVNVFSPDYRPTEHLARYIQARSIYQSSVEAPLRLEIDQKNCIQHPGFSGKQAWNVSIDSSINGSFSLMYATAEKPPLQYFIRVGSQNIYGTLPPGTPFHVCFPANVTVNSFTHLPAVDRSEE